MRAREKGRKEEGITLQVMESEIIGKNGSRVDRGRIYNNDHDFRHEGIDVTGSH